MKVLGKGHSGHPKQGFYNRIFPQLGDLTFNSGELTVSGGIQATGTYAFSGIVWSRFIYWKEDGSEGPLSYPLRACKIHYFLTSVGSVMMPLFLLQILIT